MSDKIHQIGWRLPIALLERLQASARADRRTVNAQATVLLEEALALRSDKVPSWRRDTVLDRAKHS